MSEDQASDSADKNIRILAAGFSLAFAFGAEEEFRKENWAWCSICVGLAISFQFVFWLWSRIVPRLTPRIVVTARAVATDSKWWVSLALCVLFLVGVSLAFSPPRAVTPQQDTSSPPTAQRSSLRLQFNNQDASPEQIRAISTFSSKKQDRLKELLEKISLKLDQAQTASGKFDNLIETNQINDASQIEKIRASFGELREAFAGYSKAEEFREQTDVALGVDYPDLFRLMDDRLQRRIELVNWIAGLPATSKNDPSFGSAFGFADGLFLVEIESCSQKLKVWIAQSKNNTARMQESFIR